ncbi:SulP family inorganic anion transporter [Nocardia stercoris]|uniref:SulP family inorganic anion transporter n=1 Tax=Nocardia stercoris TaxID=2483361 RepID=A0A3M2KU48_9NOCA|nr:SulP family inorganic anion transporter [Nocardia stercoris]RMI29172.1 SulP family inorganic anion transporter [Nocardia stercoris]
MTNSGVRESLSKSVAAARAKLGRPRRIDLVAGAVTGLFSIPEGMAYASIAGFDPVAGLYAGIVPAVVGSLFTPTVLMITTLTSAIALTSRSVLGDAGLDVLQPGNVSALCLVVGILMLVLALIRAGVVLSFVSNAVMTGFSTGIALSIITGVFKDATGYKPPAHNKLAQVWQWLTGIGHWDRDATLVAIATVVVWAAARTVRRLEPLALLVSLVVVTLVATLSGIDVETVRGIAHIPAALPGISTPNWSAIPHLFGGGLAVAMVALAQGAGVAPSMPNPDGSRSNVNGEFAAQGLANVSAGLFSSMPVGGSLSRTGVAASVGARTRWAGIVSGPVLAIAVLLGGSLAEKIPMPVIGGLVMVIGLELITGKIGDIRLILQSSKLSALAMIVTFLATTTMPLHEAIVLGALLSLLLYCVQSARRDELTALTRVDGAWQREPVPAAFTPEQVVVVDYSGQGFFAESSRLQGEFPDPATGHRAVLILVLSGNPVPGTSLLKQFRRYETKLRDAGGHMIVAGVAPGTAKWLRRTGFADRVPIVPETPVVLGGLDTAMTQAREWLDRPPVSRA